jgi:long-chain acyl-CoA synthetase
LLACGMQLVHLLKLDSRDAYLGLLPLFHIGGLAMTLATMLAGGKAALLERFEPAAVPGVIAAEQCTFFVTFPPMLAAILDAREKAQMDLSSLRAGCGVDSPETIERFLKAHPRAVFYSLYGQTEAMPVSGGDYRQRPGSIGRPAILTRVALFDDGERPVPMETPGEICVRSPAVFQGYWNLPEETAYTFRSGWHHTGDLGRVDAEGFLWYGGRKPEKELIKTGGENVYPAEVEKALLAHEAVAEACVFGVPDAQWGEAVKALCVLRPGATVSAVELIDFVAAGIARYKKPKYIVFVDEIPKTAGGAVDRAQVRKAFAP